MRRSVRALVPWLAAWAAWAPAAAQTPCGEPPGEPRVVMVAQRRPPASEPGRYSYAQFGARADAMALNGALFGAAPDGTITQFISLANGAEQIRARLEDHVRNVLLWTPEQAAAFRGIVMPDIEGAVHPRRIHAYDPAVRARIIARYAAAFAAVRAVYPSAEIVWFGVPTGSGNGVPPESTAALIEAVTSRHAGFDELDGIAVVLYPRWGPRDAGTGRTFPTVEHLRARLRSAAGSTLDAAEQIRAAAWERSGRCLRVLPLLTWRVYNPVSRHETRDGDLLDEHLLTSDARGALPLKNTLFVLLDCVAERGLPRVAFWSAWGGNDVELEPDRPPGVELGGYFLALMRCYAAAGRRAPYLGVPGDADGDGCLSAPEQTDLLSRIALLPPDPLYDLTDDGLVDAADLDAALRLVADHACP